MSADRLDSWATFTFCLLLGGFVFVNTLGYPDVQGQGFGQGPGFYPQFLAGILIFLGTLFLFQSLGNKGVDTLDKGSKKPRLNYMPVILLNLLALVLVFLMKYVGFFVSGFFLIFLTVLLIRRSPRIQHLKLDLAFSIGMIVLVYIVFEVFVGIELPGSIFVD